MPAISVTNLQKFYGPVAALRGVSFQIERGETFALLGPNGAGKTTAIEILEGYRQRDGGDVTVLGLDPSRAGRALRQRIGLVLQTTALEHELTVHETVTAFSRAYPASLEVNGVIAQVGLTEASAKRVKILSGGQQRRLEIALGIVGDPEVIFLDEPTTGLDPDARRKVWKLIRGLNARSKTIVMSSHYMDEVEALADRIAVMVDGQIHAEGSPAQLQARFARQSVIRFALNGKTLPKGFPARLKTNLTRSPGAAVITVDDPVPALGELTRWAQKSSFDLSSITVSRASLEDIYLELTALGSGDRS